MVIPSRQYFEIAYPFGAEGQEKAKEIDQSGNHYTSQFWEMDPRIGRRWNLDPKYNSSESRYVVNADNPNFYVDPLGDFTSRFGAWLYKISHGGTIGRDTKSKEFFVSKQVDYTGEGTGISLVRRFDWNGRTSPYNGSGWGHSARSLVASLSTDGKVSNLFELGWNSMLQSNSVALSGDLLEKVKQDPDVIRYENWIVKQLKGKAAGNYAFKSSQIPASEGGGIQLGGDRGSLNPFDPNSTKTWQVGLNPLTWAVRSVNISANVQLSADGAMTITYSFEDNLDLRPEKGGKVFFGGAGNSPFSSDGGNRPWQYNAVSSLLGVPYHDVLGGNDHMKVTATWISKK